MRRRINPYVYIEKEITAVDMIWRCERCKKESVNPVEAELISPDKPLFRGELPLKMSHVFKNPYNGRKCPDCKMTTLHIFIAFKAS